MKSQSNKKLLPQLTEHQVGNFLSKSILIKGPQKSYLLLLTNGLFMTSSQPNTSEAIELEIHTN